MKEMITVTKRYRTETGHRLCNYDGKCAHLHGHSYLFEITATAPKLDKRGMIVDFKDLKQATVGVLEPWDHALILQREDPLVQRFGEDGIAEILKATNNHFPRYFLWDENPTAENMARIAGLAIQAKLRFFWDVDRIVGEASEPEIPCPIVVDHVRVWETADSHADWYRVDVQG